MLRLIFSHSIYWVTDVNDNSPAAADDYRREDGWSRSSRGLAVIYRRPVVCPHNGELSPRSAAQNVPNEHEIYRFAHSLKDRTCTAVTRQEITAAAAADATAKWSGSTRRPTQYMRSVCAAANFDKSPNYWLLFVRLFVGYGRQICTEIYTYQRIRPIDLTSQCICINLVNKLLYVLLRLRKFIILVWRWSTFLGRRRHFFSKHV